MDIKKLLDDAMQNILEAKREQGKEEKYTKATDKQDDGEGLDPVGKGDSDIDNDGDSDETDQYLRKRRAAIAKNMKEQTELEEASKDLGFKTKVSFGSDGGMTITSNDNVAGRQMAVLEPIQVKQIHDMLMKKVSKKVVKDLGSKSKAVFDNDGSLVIITNDTSGKQMIVLEPSQAKKLHSMMMNESVQLEEADGWIAMYNGKKVEITKSDAKDLYSAKMYAAKELKVPKSKMGLLAIEPAYNESLEEASADEIRSGMPGFVGMDFAKKADDDDLVAMAKLKDERAKIFNNSLKPIDDQINKLRKKYRLKPIK